MKEEKLSKDFVLHLRIPIDVRSSPEKVSKYVQSKDLMFHNIELTGHRVSWYHKEPKGDDKIFYTITLAYDAKLGHLQFIHANTEDKAGDAIFTTNFILKDLMRNGLITKAQEEYIRNRMGLKPTTKSASGGGK
jgi:hypothetical protein